LPLAAGAPDWSGSIGHCAARLRHELAPQLPAERCVACHRPRRPGTCMFDDENLPLDRWSGLSGFAGLAPAALFLAVIARLRAIEPLGGAVAAGRPWQWRPVGWRCKYLPLRHSLMARTCASAACRTLRRLPSCLTARPYAISHPSHLPVHRPRVLPPHRRR
jgi:hypothetical protein